MSLDISHSQISAGNNTQNLINRRSGNFRCYNIFVNVRAYENLTHEYFLKTKRICLDCLSALVHSEEPLPQQPSKCAGTRGSRGHTTLVRKSPSKIEITLWCALKAVLQTV